MTFSETQLGGSWWSLNHSCRCYLGFVSWLLSETSLGAILRCAQVTHPWAFCLFWCLGQHRMSCCASWRPSRCLHFSDCRYWSLMPSRLPLSWYWRELCYPLCCHHQLVFSHLVSESCRVWPLLGIRFACLLVSMPWDFFACHPLFECGSFVVSEQDWSCLISHRRYSPLA